MSPRDIAWKPFAVSQVRPAIAIALARPGVDEAGVAATDDRLDRLGIVVVVKIPKHDEVDFRVGLQPGIDDASRSVRFPNLYSVHHF